MKVLLVICGVLINMCSANEYEMIKGLSYNQYTGYTIFNYDMNVPDKLNCNCGYTYKEQKRIVTGDKTGENEYTFMVALLYRDTLQHFCGGVIITEKEILTTANCIEGESASSILAKVGAHDLTLTKSMEITKTHSLETILMHDEYNSDTKDNNICILKVQVKIDYTAFVGPACFPYKLDAKAMENEKVIALGWGTYANRGGTQFRLDYLKKLDLNVVSLDTCKASWNSVTENHICTYSDFGDTCVGDAGGPVIWNDPDTSRYTVIGLISHGARLCKTKDVPSVNTNVAAYGDWVLSNITFGTRKMHHLCYKKAP